MKAPGRDMAMKTCPLLRQEETTVEVGETTIRQEVAETGTTLHRQEDTGTVRALRHLRLGGRRRALAETSPGNPGQRRTRPMPTGMTEIGRAHV